MTALRTAASPPEVRTRLGARRLAPLTVAALTVAALVLRLPGVGESLFGDELYTYAIATQDSPRGAYDAMQQVENNPPLFYAVAWLMAKLGDPTLTIRLPSLIFSTAAVPLIYLLGRRVAGDVAGLLAAALWTLSPSAIFYASEARAYALLAFLAVLSILLLLAAVESPRRRWLVLYAVCACALVYTHYTGFFVLGGQAAWALWAHRRRAVELMVAYAAVGLAFLAWVPSYSNQPEFRGWLGAEPWTLEETVRGYAIAFIGHTYSPLREVPGRLALVALLLAVAVAAAVVAAGFLRRPRSLRRVPTGIVLIGLVTIAVPAGLVFASALGADVYGPRNLGASLPGLCLLLGALLASLTRWALVALGGVVLLACALGTVAMLDPDRDRPPFKRAAQAIDAEDGGRAVVLEYPLLGPDGPTGRSLEVNFERPHRFFKISLEDATLPDGVATARTLYVVAPWVPPWRNAPLPPGVEPGFRLVERRVWPSWIPVALSKYER